MKHTTLRFLAIAALFAAAVVPATASTLYGTTAGFSLTVGCHNGDGSDAGGGDFGGNNGSSSAAISFDEGVVCPYLGYSDAETSGAANAYLGRLGSIISSEGTGIHAQGGAGTHSEWFDQITIMSGTLAVGTPVLLNFSMSLAALLSDSGSIPPDSVSAQSSLTASTIYCTAFSCGAATILGLGESTPGNYYDFTSATMSTHVGDTIALDAILNLSSDAFGCGAGCKDIATTDASHTALFGIAPQGSDFSYQSASGVQYPTSPSEVPEPSTLALLGTSLTLLAHLVRRRT